MYASAVKSALITGARGFIGRHLALHLSEEGMQVRGVGHGAWTEEDFARFGVSRWLNGDVTRPNLSLAAQGLVAVDCVVHLAGGSSVGPSFSAPEEDFRRTVVSMVEVLEWVRTNSPKSAVVFASSAAVYGAGHARPIRPDDPIRPTSPYGVHKRIAEELCASYSRSFGMRISIVRLFSVYGPGLRKQLLWDTCGKLARGCDVLEMGGTGEEQRDFLHVRDASASLAAAACAASDSCPIFNAGTGQAVSVREITEELSRAWGGVRQVRFSGTSRAGDPDFLVADVAGRSPVVGSRFCAWRDGISEYVDWFRLERKNSR